MSKEFQHDACGFDSLRVAALDLNGIARGKHVPLGPEGAVPRGVKFPVSVLNLDILGADIEGSPLVMESGDQDGFLRPTGRGPVPVPWLEGNTGLLPVWMFDETGAPFEGCARQALAAIDARLAAKGITAVVAMEMEFYLFGQDGQPPKGPLSGRVSDAPEILSLQQLDEYDAFLRALYAGCAQMGIPADAAISEAGPGQFEINLNHVSSALQAADDACLFKSIVKGLAQQNGMQASFMAKPYADQPGTGLHAHVSFVDASGRNLFDDGSAAGTPLLHQAIAGCLASLADSTLLFAPHGNSYKRLEPGHHAPSSGSWGYENRTVALRVPSGAPKARRFEHRVAGGDCNPYLALGAILGGALIGIEDGLTPPAPSTGTAHTQTLPRGPQDWASAIDAFENSSVMKRIFPELLIDNMLRCKRQEMAVLEGWPEDEVIALYRHVL